MSELELDDDLEVFSLSDIEVDEISFVHRGANQAAHIMLVKSEDGEPDPEDVAVGYTIARYGVSLPAAEASVRRHFGGSTPPSVGSGFAVLRFGESAM